MQKTITFKSECGKFEFTVKESFCKKSGYRLDSNDQMVYHEYENREVLEEPVYNLMTKHNMASYLHNESGPAIVYLETKGVAYFKDGKQLSEEEGKKMQYNSEFSDHVIMDLGL